MSLFEVYQKETKITTPKGEIALSLKPLPGKLLPKLYQILRVVSKAPTEGTEQEKGDAFLATLDEPTVAMLHELCVETLAKSYPNESRAEIEDFATQNMLKLFPAILSTNMSE